MAEMGRSKHWGYREWEEEQKNRGYIYGLRERNTQRIGRADKKLVIKMSTLHSHLTSSQESHTQSHNF